VPQPQTKKTRFSRQLLKDIIQEHTSPSFSDVPVGQGVEGTTPASGSIGYTYEDVKNRIYSKLENKAIAAEAAGMTVGVGGDKVEQSPTGVTKFDPHFEEAEQKYGLPTGLLKSMAREESRFNPEAVSEVGAIGLMQFMPATAKAFDIDPKDPLQSIDAAGRYIQNSLREFDGDVALAVASYHAGVKGVQGYVAGKAGTGVGPRTKNYVRNILGEDLKEQNEYEGRIAEKVDKPPKSMRMEPLKLDPGIYEDPESGDVFSVGESGEFEILDIAAKMWQTVEPSHKQRKDDYIPRASAKRYEPFLHDYTGKQEKPEPIPNVRTGPNAAKHRKKDQDFELPFRRGAGNV
jgi:hypothetical protein